MKQLEASYEPATQSIASLQPFSVDSKYPIAALIGNPNVGKSTIFNALTGLKQHTGNWPGKTVSLAYGKTKGKYPFTIVDLPGTYSLSPHSIDEEVTRDYILFGNYDICIIVVDATCLQRNLHLVLTTLEITTKVIVCVNLMDEAKRKDIHIDLNLLENLLGVPVIGCSASQETGLDCLLEAMYQSTKSKDVISAYQEKPVNPLHIEYESDIEEALIRVQYKLLHPYQNRWMALRLLCEDQLNIVQQPLDSKDTKYRERILAQVQSKADQIVTKVVSTQQKTTLDQTVDKYLTSTFIGIPIMILLLLGIFWITMVGANVPSQMLSTMFDWIELQLFALAQNWQVPSLISDIFISGMYRTLAWVVSVMLPPMAIFFPLFTLLEDLGYLPRIAFNLDHYFQKACACGKQALTMCMGFGCNAAGIVGCRIITSPRERLIAILTNCFVPCNGRFPILIVIITIFFSSLFQSPWNSIVAALALTLTILSGIFMTLLFSRILSKTLLKGLPSTMILELPPYRKPQVGRILLRSILDRTLFVLARAIAIAAPAGIIIWIFANVTIQNQSILSHTADFLAPLGNLMGLDGYILLAFLLGFPANEIVIPILMMSYMATGHMSDYESLSSLKNLLLDHGWTWLTAVNMLIFTLFHFPCGTTVLTIFKETKSIKWTLTSILLPTGIGIVCCILLTMIVRFLGLL